MIDTPLQQVKVLDLTTILFGPYTTQLLGDLGADVIKIEAPAGDPVRHVGAARNDAMGAVFLGANRNKRSVILNLKTTAGREALQQLLTTADIFVHNIRPQKIAALGFDPASVRQLNPKIVYAGLYGYREGGPYSGKPAYDDVIQGESGIADLFARRDGEPMLMPSAMADKNSALIAACGILGAYIKKLRTGKPVALECTMFESMVSYNLIEHQQGQLFYPPVGETGYARVLSKQRKPHKTADGYICLLAYSDAQWRSFWQLAGCEHYASDPRFTSLAQRSKNIDALYEIAASMLSVKTTSEWLAALEREQVPAGRVTRLEDLNTDPHLQAIGFFRKFNHPTEGQMHFADTPYVFDQQSLPMQCGPPQLGQHTDEILSEAGMSDAQITAASTPLSG